MTKKQFTLLLFMPAIFFIFMAGAALVTCIKCRKLESGDSARRMRFETFVTNVRSGKWNLTTDRWLEGMRRQEDLIEAYEGFYTTISEMMMLFILVSLGAFSMQIAVIFSARKHLKKLNFQNAFSEFK